MQDYNKDNNDFQNQKNPTKDLFGLSDIGKIQEEIARDLTVLPPQYLSPQSLHEQLQQEMPQNENPPANDARSDFLRVENVSPSSPVVGESTNVELHSKMVNTSSDTMFYRETINTSDGTVFHRETMNTSDDTEFHGETMKPVQKKSWGRVAAVLLLICTIGTGMLGFGMGSGWALVRSNSESGANAAVERQGTSGLPFIGTSYVFESITPEIATISDMVELLAPSVAAITTHRTEASRLAFRPTSMGSGIIYASTADRIFIATSLYVVRAGCRWDVSIAGSPPVAAWPVDMNNDHDLAVLYIYKEVLVAAGIDTIAFATFGDSDEMRIGDTVLAIGNAMGEGTSVTRGIISAEQRQIYLPPYRPNHSPTTILQTDAAINYGNSGGPLLNTRGEIVGINMNQATDIIIGSSLAEGMGYSITSNVAAPILESIAANYRRPAIGITGISLANDELNRAERWGIPALGVLVDSAQVGRPAYLAGIRHEDVITGFDGQPIFDMDQLQAAIRAREIGDIVEVRLLRGGTIALTVELELAKLVRDTF